METWLSRWRGRSLAARGGLLGLAVLVFYVAVAPVAFFIGSMSGLWAAAVAAMVCLVGAAVALAISHLLRSPEHALYGVLFGMAARMCIPLASGLLLHLCGGALAEAGVLYYLLVFYPLTLGVETMLSLPGVESGNRCSSVSQDTAS